MTSIPKTQYAVQLVGPSRLELNKAKAVGTPGAYEILLKMEAVGLCFSDLKLLKQFTAHPRKGEVLSGLPKEVLAGIQSYVPNDKPVVPGHEVVCRVVAVGEKVRQHKVGERVIVQADWRDLPTNGSNAAFGYNFEGGLQEYVIVDERVVIDTKGERFLIPAKDEKSASAVALVEPWACVEGSYVNAERNTLKAGGKTVIVSQEKKELEALGVPFAKDGKPASCQWVKPGEVGGLANEAYDDIIYYGQDKAVIETLNDKLAARGTICVVLGGAKIGAKVNVGVGRVHYGMTRWIGTTGGEAAEAYRTVPANGELRANDHVVVIGAGGPMGQMHVIRNACTGIAGIRLVGTDMDDARLASVVKKVQALAKTNGVPFKVLNTAKEKDTTAYTYYALMAPVAALVAEAITTAADGAIINIFAGIPAPTKHEIDLDAYIAKRCFMFGTSGSVIEDMRIVLRKVEANRLDTNASVDAISGMAGATAGIAAIENRTLAGKIIVYPMLHDLPLIPLTELHQHLPTVAAKLQDGQWTKAAEEELLRTAGGK